MWILLSNIQICRCFIPPSLETCLKPGKRANTLKGWNIEKSAKNSPEIFKYFYAKSFFYVLIHLYVQFLKPVWNQFCLFSNVIQMEFKFFSEDCWVEKKEKQIKIQKCSLSLSLFRPSLPLHFGLLSFSLVERKCLTRKCTCWQNNSKFKNWHILKIYWIVRKSLTTAISLSNFKTYNWMSFDTHLWYTSSSFK